MNVNGIWKNRLAALPIILTISFSASGCSIQGNASSEPAPDVVHQTEDDGAAIYADDPIAAEPQLDPDGLNGISEDSNGQGETISAEPYKGDAD